MEQPGQTSVHEGADLNLRWVIDTRQFPYQSYSRLRMYLMFNTTNYTSWPATYYSGTRLAYVYIYLSNYDWGGRPPSIQIYNPTYTLQYEYNDISKTAGVIVGLTNITSMEGGFYKWFLCYPCGTYSSPDQVPGFSEVPVVVWGM